MQVIDFTKPSLYEDVVTFNQGEGSVNNFSRCKIVTGVDETLRGCSVKCKFNVNGSKFNSTCKIVSEDDCLVDIIFNSTVLIAGTNKVELMIVRSDGSIAQSPNLKYEVWREI